MTRLKERLRRRISVAVFFDEVREMAKRQKDAAAQAVEYLNSRNKPADRARVLVMGTGCDGRCRPERPCTIRSLRDTGALVDFFDPALPEANCGGLRARGVRSLTPSGLGRYDLVILQQNCDDELQSRVAASARHLLDARPAKGDCII